MDLLFDIITDCAKYYLNIKDVREQHDFAGLMTDEFFDNYYEDKHEEFTPDEIEVWYDSEYSYDNGDYDTAPWSSLEANDIEAEGIQDIINAFKKYSALDGDENKKKAVEYVEDCMYDFLKDRCECDAEKHKDAFYDDRDYDF